MQSSRLAHPAVVLGQGSELDQLSIRGGSYGHGARQPAKAGGSFQEHHGSTAIVHNTDHPTAAVEHGRTGLPRSFLSHPVRLSLVVPSSQRL
ncbi:hypothetical protein SSP35_08_00430 [Streptomyces sp. NBRC 110611]|nr:hypothetical protein SSP35_08_00430 [Streptomyces sp. NBRC 110611]